MAMLIMRFRICVMPPPRPAVNGKGERDTFSGKIHQITNKSITTFVNDAARAAAYTADQIPYNPRLNKSVDKCVDAENL